MKTWQTQNVKNKTLAEKCSIDTLQTRFLHPNKNAQMIFETHAYKKNGHIIDHHCGCFAPLKHCCWPRRGTWPTKTFHRRIVQSTTVVNHGRVVAQKTAERTQRYCWTRRRIHKVTQNWAKHSEIMNCVLAQLPWHTAGKKLSALRAWCIIACATVRSLLTHFFRWDLMQLGFSPAFHKAAHFFPKQSWSHRISCSFVSRIKVATRIRLG